MRPFCWFLKTQLGRRSSKAQNGALAVAQERSSKAQNGALADQPTSQSLYQILK